MTAELLRVLVDHENRCHAALADAERLTVKVDMDRIRDRWVRAATWLEMAMAEAVK